MARDAQVGNKMLNLPPVVSRVNLTGNCQTLNRNNIFFVHLMI